MTDAMEPKKILPTDRINVAKQFDILRAYGAHYEATGKPVKNEDIAKIVGLSSATVSLSNAFFNDTKLIQRSDVGGYTPCQEAVLFSRAYQWNEETAPQKLAPAFERTWFTKALLPKLKFSALEEKDAVQHLGEETGTDKESEGQLKMLIEFLVTCGLVVKDGTKLKLVPQGPRPKPSDSNPVNEQKSNETGNNLPPPPAFDMSKLTQHALPLKGGRKVVVFAPTDITTKELERVKNWLGLQLLIEDETQIAGSSGDK